MDNVMKNVLKTLTSLFTKTFQVLEENKQTSFIQAIGKDNDGYTTVDVIPVGGDQACTFFPHQVLSTPGIANQFMPTDIKLLKGIITAEGDIFIEAKEYCDNDVSYILRSLLNNETWQLTRKEIETEKQILNRINKRFFSYLLQA